MKMLEHEGVKVEGMHAVVVGRSTIVGKPMALLLINAGRHGDGLPFEDARPGAP